MNIVDAVLLLMIGLAAYSGWKKGFIDGTLELLSWVSTLLIGILLYPYVAHLLTANLKTTPLWTFPLSFITTLLVTRLLISTLVNGLYKVIPPQVHESAANTFMGIIPGLISGVIYAALGATIALLVPFSGPLTRQSQESRLANRLSKQVELVQMRIAPNLSEAIKRTSGNLAIEPSSDKFIKLPFFVKDPKPREDLEAQMLVLVNRERQKKGLNPLKFDPQLLPVARAHSRDMFARSYFSHVSPEGLTPFDRIRAAKVPFITAGENLALAQTLRIAHTGLMNSPGHRANILRPAFGRVGIGILDGGVYGIMITQNFRN